MNDQDNSIEAIIKLLTMVREYVREDSDMTWTGYKNPEALREQLRGFIATLRKGNISVLKKIEFEFLPTGSLQEHSISNGWSDEYELLSAQFHELSKILKNN